MILSSTDVRRLVRAGMPAAALVIVIELWERDKPQSNAPATRANGHTVTDPSLRKPMTNAERARKFREKHKPTVTNGSVTIVTPSPTPPFSLSSETVVNKRVVKKKDSNDARDDEKGFLEFRAAYPKRGGTNSWAKALIAYRKAIANGATEREVTDGALRYARYCDAKGDTGGPYVQMATTWINGKEWENDFQITTARPNGKTPRLNSVDRATEELLADIKARREGGGGDSPGQRLAQDVPRLR